MEADIYNDLQDTGLLQYAECWGLLKGVDEYQPFLQQLPPYLQQDSQNTVVQDVGACPVPETHGQQVAALPGGAGSVCSQQVKDEPMQPASSGSGDYTTRIVSTEADLTAAAAVAAVRQAHAVIQEVVASNHRLAPMTSTTQQSEKPAPGRGSKRSKAAAVEPPKAAAGANKGLRQFALKVCEKVRERGRTTYNEVADLLVLELSQLCDSEGKDVPDDKTIRRRVYDAINVLMAMSIIEREKKDIIWKGLPELDLGTGPRASDPGGARPAVSHEEVQQLRQERLRHLSDVDRKQHYLQELVEQHSALKQLIHRNAAQQHQQKGGTEIQLPFILIQARPDATVEVSISEDMQEVTFDIYNSAIQIHDDSGIVKQLAAATAATRLGTPRSMQV